MNYHNTTNLAELCRRITSQEGKSLPPGHKLGSRLVCQEYSKSVQDVKTYPLISDEPIFVLCWNIDHNAVIHSTLCPAPEPFHYHRSFQPGERTQLHTHDYLELAYIVKGEFRQRILNNDITFHEGELCLIDKNCLHQDYLLEEPAIILFFGIANDMFSEVMDENITTRKIISFLQASLLKQKDVQQYLLFKPQEENNPQLEECFFQLLSELHADRIGARYICKGLLLRIFRILSMEYDFSLSREQRKTMNWIIFEEIHEYIQHNYATVTIQDLVNTFHFQEDYFNRLIKNKTGLTYSAYVQQIRLEHAERLLTSTTKSVEEIADIVGYHNKGYFYRIFQEKYGTTPSRYRKRESLFSS